jgi:hypothetical protein
MGKIKDLISHYSKIIAILQSVGINKVRLFKGFTKEDEHDLNIVIIEYSGNLDLLLSHERDATDKLTSLLGCTVYITDYLSINPDFYGNLDASNSVELTISAEVERKEAVFTSLNQIFGEQWEFIKREYFPDKEATDKEWCIYNAEMSQMRQLIEGQEEEEQEPSRTLTAYSGSIFSSKTSGAPAVTVYATLVIDEQVIVKRAFPLGKTPSPDALTRTLEKAFQELEEEDFSPQQGFSW